MPYDIATAMAEFDAWSRSYDRSMLQRALFGPSHRLLIGKLGSADQRILDVGCGTARFAAEVFRKVANSQVFGLDLSEKMLGRASVRARSYGDRLHLVRGDSEYLPFASDYFDVVTCSHSFHHYPNQAEVVAEMFRVLRPDGRLMIIDGCRDDWWGWFIFDVLVTWAEGGVVHCSARRFRELFQRAGFQNVRQEFRGKLIPYLLTIGQAEKGKTATLLPLSRAA
jgi:ubiquinone/menaquinone biosynthesis C-methylase UbiE